MKKELLAIVAILMLAGCASTSTDSKVQKPQDASAAATEQAEWDAWADEDDTGGW